MLQAVGRHARPYDGITLGASCASASDHEDGANRDEIIYLVVWGSLKGIIDIDASSRGVVVVVERWCER